MTASGGCPDPVYAETILAPPFAASRRWLFGPMLDASEARLLMLHATGLTSSERAGRVWAALPVLREAGPEGFVYEPRVADLSSQSEARTTETGAQRRARAARLPA